jgi:nitrate/nitrite transporter NarK
VTYAIAYFANQFWVLNAETLLTSSVSREGMGFSTGQAQCLVAPPYAFAAILMFCTAWVGDKYHTRGPIIIFNCILALIGLPLMGFAKTSAVRYFGVFLTTGGTNANIPPL